MDGLDVRIADVLSHRWTLILVRGIAAILFGILTWVNPGITMMMLVITFGLYALIDGIATTWMAIEGRAQERSWALLVVGLVSIAVGALSLGAPGVTAVTFLVYIAVWSIVRGAFEIAVAVRVRKEVHGEWRLVLAAVASIIFGVVILARPAAGALALLWLIGVYAFVFGILLVMLAFAARHFPHAAAA